jgi:sulfite exporter TauE/SafE
MLGSGRSVARNTVDLSLFLVGRLIGYLSFGILAWTTGRLFLSNPIIRGRFLACSFIVLGAMLIIYNLRNPKRKCEISAASNFLRNLLPPGVWYYPLVFGFLTGINVCPPFLLVVAEAMNSGTLFKSIIFFATFFIGTSLFFLPFPLLGKFKDKGDLQIVGKLALYIIAGYYLYKGFLGLGGLL